MLNQVVCVGRLVKDIEVEELETGKKVSRICLAISRSYKNADGDYETDFINVTLWDNIAQNTSDYCRKGDIIGVKGRLECNTIEDEEGNKKYYTNVVAEKITFLSSAKKED